MIKHLIEELVAAAPPESASAVDLPFPNSARSAARRLGRHVALKLDEHWRRAGRGEGPIDLIDFFSGCGGMSAGFKAVNGAFPTFRHIAAVDIDGVANKSYEANVGLRPEEISVADFAADPTLADELVARSGRREDAPLVLIGCAPCQGFSSHRNASGGKDKRNTLFSDFVEVAVRLRPQALVVENVPELLTDRYWPYVKRAKARLTEAGYHVHVGVYNMAGFGVPQDRFRAVMLAMPRPFEPPMPFLKRRRFKTVRDAIGELPPVAAGERPCNDPLHYSAGHKASTLEVIRAVPKDGGNRPPNVGPECLTRAHRRQGKAAYEDVYGRLWWDRPAITVTAYARNPASGRFIHPEQDRGLTVREAALLQGFPGNFWFDGSLDQRFRQIGNAVPPIFAAYLACHILGEMFGPVPYEVTEGITRSVGASFSRLIPTLKAGRMPKELAARQALSICA